jgi:Predicted membrane protein
MRFLLNILWLIFGGLWTSLGYLTGGLILMITIIGIPFGLQVWKMAVLALWPFGKTISEKSGGMGCLNIFMNVFWILFGGIETCISHLIWGVICCITIIGIPFGKQHFKLAGLALFPFGREIKDK